MEKQGKQYKTQVIYTKYSQGAKNNVYCDRDRTVWQQTLIYDAFILKFKSPVYKTKARIRILEKLLYIILAF